MGAPLDILILRDPRESPKKCSLTPLRGREGITFARYDPERKRAVGSRILLHVEGELISERDCDIPLLVIDCSWRRVPQLLATLEGDLRPRRLPPFATAYPRASKDFLDPASGLASIEALYAALHLLGRPRPDLLDDYRWAAKFLELNPALGRR